MLHTHANFNWCLIISTPVPQDFLYAVIQFPFSTKSMFIKQGKPLSYVIQYVCSKSNTTVESF